MFFLRVIQIFYENRFSFLNEWLDFCNSLKMTSNLNVLRSILLSSLTIGLPHYIIEIRDITLSMKKVTHHDLEININKSEYLDNLGNKSSNEPFNLYTSEDSMISKVTKTLLDVNEIYQNRIDDLLDLSDMVDLSKEKYGDSTNLILINRALILTDLVKYLDDKFFQDNFSYALCKSIDNIITQVIIYFHKISVINKLTIKLTMIYPELSIKWD